MICARRTSPAPSFCERVIRASLCASSSLNPRTRSVIATSPAWTRAPCNAPDPEKSYPTCRMHHLGGFRPQLAIFGAAHKIHKGGAGIFLKPYLEVFVPEFLVALFVGKWRRFTRFSRLATSHVNTVVFFL